MAGELLMSGGPEIDITGSPFSLVPDNLIVRKDIKLKPLPLVLGGSLIWNLESKGFKYQLSCRDSIIHGRVTVDVGARVLEYRKRLALPVAGLGKFACFVLGGRLALDPVTHRVKPSYHIGMEVRQGAAEVLKLNTLRLKPRLFVGRIGVEANTDVTFQIPKQLLFDSGGSNDAASDAAWGVSFDVQELNVVLVL